MLKFAIVFKSFECFCPFLRLTIITGQRSFSTVADGLLEITPETNNSFEHFHCEICKLSFLILQIFKTSFLFDLVTNKARKLKVKESNQAKANLTKPWLATDEANRLPVV